MKWFKLNNASQLKLPKSSPLFFFISAIASKASGTLQISHEKTIRQIRFQNGFAYMGASNLKSELPIYFLLKLKRITESQAQQHLSKPEKGKGLDWKQIAQDFSIRENELATLQHEHAKFLFQGIASIQQADLVFTPQPSPPGIQPPPTKWVLSLAPYIMPEALNAALPEYTLTAGVKLEGDADHIARELELSAEEKGLLITLLNNSRVEEVLSASFLGEQKIRAYLILFAALGYVSIQTDEATNREKFLDTLTEDLRKTRLSILEAVENLEKTNYYDWINSTPEAPPIEIRRKAEAIIEKVASPSVESLFIGKEHGLWKYYLSRLNHARLVLSDPNKRLQYNRNLVTGINNFQEQQIGNKDASPLGSLLQDARNNPQNHELLQALSMEYEKGNKAPELLDVLAECLLAQHKVEDAFALIKDNFSRQPRSLLLRRRLETSFGTRGIVETLASLYKNREQLHHYDILGINANAPLADIKKAYRNISKFYHPDLFSTQADMVKSQANVIYKKINAAFITLRNSTAKTTYDTALFAAPNVTNAKTSNQRPTTPHGIKYLKLAEDAYRTGNVEAARQHLKLGMQMEPSCTAFAEKLKQWE